MCRFMRLDSHEVAVVLSSLPFEINLFGQIKIVNAGKLAPRREEFLVVLSAFDECAATKFAAKAAWISCANARRSSLTAFSVK